MRALKWILGITCGLTLLVLSLIIVGGMFWSMSTREAEKYLAGDDSVPLEAKLAIVNAGRSLPRDDLTIARFRSLLDQLSNKFVETPEQIADQSVKAQDLLRSVGVDESPLLLMEGLNRLSPLTRKNPDYPNHPSYAEYAGLYVTMREKGTSREESLEALQAMIDVIDRIAK